MSNKLSPRSELVLKVLAAVAALIFVIKFGVHIGALLLLLVLVSLVLGVIISVLGIFFPETLKRYAEQAAESYAYLKGLLAKTINKKTSDNKTAADISETQMPAAEAVEAVDPKSDSK